MLNARSSATAFVARLKARPSTTPAQAGPAGLQHIRFRPKREALLSVPELALNQPAVLAVMLHGAGGNAEQGLNLLHPYAEMAGIILLAPESRKQSWDIISDAQYGPDVDFIDECLRFVFARYAIDPERLVLGGFSDGASYALSLGLSNGSLFSFLLALSPGFMAPVRMEGRPQIFLSHGTNDQVLSINACGRKLARILHQRQLPLLYREFEGPHTVPDSIKNEAVEFVSNPPSSLPGS